MKVFKFGGASVADPGRIRNVGKILSTYQGQPLLVVISAMGKTTNALEGVVHAYVNGEGEKALQLFEDVKQKHLDIASALNCKDAGFLNDFFTEVEWLLHDRPVRTYDYYYDQIVCVGELLSTRIVSEFLNNEGINNRWLDVRDILKTDNNFRDAGIQWKETAARVDDVLLPLLRKPSVVITQGFIGATDDNESTTLGREGSDYSAAIFANLLDAESQTIWKDVKGVMNADPKLYEKASWIRDLDYREVIEMAYYGAQVIHPKTIKPLQNKHIPLLVKSFIDPAGEGTRISEHRNLQLPPIIVFKESQALLQFDTKDYSFVSEGGASEIQELFDQLKFKPNLSQIAAVSLLCVVDQHPDKLDALAHGAARAFNVLVTRDLTLLTIRHYEEELLKELIGERRVVLRQQTPQTVQVLLQSK